jgi:hypothetical protein
MYLPDLQEKCTPHSSYPKNPPAVPSESRIIHDNEGKRRNPYGDNKPQEEILEAPRRGGAGFLNQVVTLYGTDK